MDGLIRINNGIDNGQRPKDTFGRTVEILILRTPRALPMLIALKTLLRIAACTSLITGGAVHAWGSQTLKTNELPADTLIVLQRGACEHRCAVYKVIIFADGSVIFDGRHYVRRPGLTKSNISLEALGQLLDEAAALRFFSLKERYGYGDGAGCDSSDTDARSAIVSISSGGASKTVLHYYGCVGAESERLKQYEEKIDSAVNTARWVK
jgi:hypothetical protein